MSLLIKTISQLRTHVSFSGDLEYDTLVPALRSAQEFVSRYVGPALLEELQANTLTAAQVALMPYVCAPVASLALLKFVGAGNVRITDLGVMRTKTSDSADAFEWQIERVVQSLKSEAFDGIEALLRYLDAHLATFPAYKDSAVYKARAGQLIRSADIFSQYYDISGSLLVLQTLSASMRTAEGTIRRLLGSKLTDLLGDNLSSDLTNQLDAARRALVYMTIARALREKLVSISDTGVQVCGISNFATVNYKQPASDKQLETSIRYFDEQASEFTADLISLLSPAVTSSGPTASPVIGSKIVAF